MALIEYLLSEFQSPSDFERLCVQLMYREGYGSINPVGGHDDKGRDAEAEGLYTALEGQRTIVFQFSLEDDIRRKVLKTLNRLREKNISSHQVIFVFNHEIKSTGLRDALKEQALKDYGRDIDIKDQRFTAARLANASYADIVRRFFGATILELQSQYDQGTLFTPEFAKSQDERRALCNVLAFAMHPFAEHVPQELIRQSIVSVLAENQDGVPEADLPAAVVQHIPSVAGIDSQDVVQQLKALTTIGDITAVDGRVRARDAVIDACRVDKAELALSRRAIIDFASQLLTPHGVERTVTSAAIDTFLCTLFSEFGAEVAATFLSDEMVAQGASRLDSDNVDQILSTVVSAWAAPAANAFRKCVRELLSGTPATGVAYLRALSRSYVCIELLGIDPKTVNIRRTRVKQSVAVLDTDVILTGIVDGARRTKISRAIARSCSELGIRCFAFEHSIAEIVHRIERSVMLFNDLGRPAAIPADKQDLASDLFLDIFFYELARGRVRSFDAFMSQYYRPEQASEHIKQVIEDVLGVGFERVDKYYIVQQDEKVERIREAIEESRTRAGRYKHPDLYKHDAMAMVVVEQQNRECIDNALLGRWYLVSSDRHMLRAYLRHQKSFKMKPSVLPVHFVGLLDQLPNSNMDADVFAAVLQSEAMLSATTVSYAPILAALCQLGIDALALGRERLLELIDDMERADFTKWLLRLRNDRERMNDEVREEVVSALERVLEESASREDKVRQLQELSGHLAKVKS